MCDCPTSGAGSSKSSPAVIGAAGGPVVLVDVITPFFGLWKGQAWVTGSRAPEFIAAGLLRPVT